MEIVKVVLFGNKKALQTINLKGLNKKE